MVESAIKAGAAFAADRQAISRIITALRLLYHDRAKRYNKMCIRDRPKGLEDLDNARQWELLKMDIDEDREDA